MSQDAVIKQALEARTNQDVVALERALTARLTGVRDWELDSSKGNWASVASAAEPAVLLVERVVNMFDALIELAVARLGDRSANWSSPAEAASYLFNLPDDRVELARKSVMALFDSDDSARTPTIAFRDHGIGLTPEEMPTTILSLNKSNKIGKLYLHGVFGKGGTTACQASDATVIVSRKHPDLLKAGEADRVAVAVITLGDAPDAKMDFFRYLGGTTSNGTPQVFSVPAGHITFDPGTYVAHINYKANIRLSTQTWNQEESVYFQNETVLFKPALPYTLSDERSSDYNKRPVDRKVNTLSGLQRRLGNLTPAANGKIIQKSNWTVISVPNLGDVRLRWWLFKGRDERRQYVGKGYNVIFTSNGQVHHGWDSYRLQTIVPDKRRVAQQLLAEIDCDGLDIRRRTRLFSTDRSQLRRSPEGKVLEAMIADALREDPDLTEAEEVLQSAALKVSDSNLSAAVLEQVNKAIGIKTPGISKQPVKMSNRRKTETTPAPDLYPEPTTIEGPDHVEIVAGSSKTLRLVINAVDGFVPDRGVLSFSEHGAIDLTMTTRGDLRRGRLLVGISAADDTAPATYPVDFTCTWEREDGSVGRVTWTTKVEVMKEPRPSLKDKQKAHSDGSVALIFTNIENQPEWTHEIPGDVQLLSGAVLAQHDSKLYGRLRGITDSIPTIMLNDDFREWNDYRGRVKGKLPELAWATRRNRYIVLVGSAVANLHIIEEKFRKRDERDGNSLEQPQAMTAMQQGRAAAISARTAVLALMDMDKMRGGDLS